MNADLDRLIRLQQLETSAEAARRTITDEPVRHQELDARVAAAQKALDDERGRLAANQTVRRDIEKELALQQGRLSKYRDQLMAVKTNREYQAMQKEIEVAQQGIRTQEDLMLERMIEHDEISALVKQAETALAAEKQAVEQERRNLAARVADAKIAIDVTARDRTELAREVAPPLLSVFDKLIRHRGTLAVVEVRDGRCTVCQVRVRPQVYSELRRHEIVFQCESCQRILYFAGPVPAAADAGAPDPPPAQ